MSHFYGWLQGSRGEATRCGTANSGIEATANGWDIGGNVHCFVNNDGEDIVHVTVTGGSNGQGEIISLGCFKKRGDKIVKIENE